MSENERVWKLVKILKNSIDIYLHMLYNMYCKEVLYKMKNNKLEYDTGNYIVK